ncbi:hypothetical protein Cri9333_2069 [Crinalium epipsammum PCC 9333]|uniref:Uncharacterized protein n=1 Tax=Crinalium epipsammum PCC 9333 TaxID=1173022 RepID=K9VZL3_9CYAN|nr:hypothetical protein [Crinalium epipsammum]AFZ12947.1 hypothetical protein Cri9333_2069 [Crinalium epipsammum PCC 9333]
MNANQDPAMEYEQFLRWAFGLTQGGIHLDIKKYVEDVINSSSLEEVSNLISSFNTSFVERYYERRNGKATFRNPNN